MSEWLAGHVWLSHYEVVVRRHGREHIVARVPSRRRAQLVAARVRDGIEVSLPAVDWRRARGVHPVNAAKCCALVLPVLQLLPWVWPRLMFSVICTALILGLLTSGTSWKQGGEDDR